MHLVCFEQLSYRYVSNDMVDIACLGHKFSISPKANKFAGERSVPASASCSRCYQFHYPNPSSLCQGGEVPQEVLSRCSKSSCRTIELC